MADATAKPGTGATVWGILMLICGVLAIALPLASAVGIAIIIGWLILISAVWHLIAAFRTGHIGGFFWQLLLAIVYGVAGVVILFYPLAGVASLTLILATFLFIEAILEGALYFNLRGRVRAGWILFDAIITLILAVLIWAQWPSSSAWALGTLLGVSLIFSGLARLMLGSASAPQ